jgi:hypothetical protein
MLTVGLGKGPKQQEILTNTGNIKAYTQQMAFCDLIIGEYWDTHPVRFWLMWWIPQPKTL